MKKIFLFTILVAFGCKKDDDPKPTGSIVGFVNLFAKSGTLLDDFSGATVSIDNTKIISTTDEYGKFELKNVTPGTYDITITKPGFGEYRQFSIPYAGGPAPGGIPTINTYTGISPTIVIGEIPSSSVTSFKFVSNDSTLALNGTTSATNGAVLIFLSKGATVSNKIYDHFVFATVENGVFNFDLLNAFQQGSNFKAVAYTANVNSTIYIDRNTNKRIYTSLGSASNVVSVTIQ